MDLYAFFQMKIYCCYCLLLLVEVFPVIHGQSQCNWIISESRNHQKFSYICGANGSKIFELELNPPGGYNVAICYGDMKILTFQSLNTSQVYHSKI